jgi:hypothetical protein
MTWILGVGPPRRLPLALAFASWALAACSTDVDYLRAGRTGGTGSDTTGAGVGGNGGEAGSSAEDAGDGAEPWDGHDGAAEQEGAAESGGGGRDGPPKKPVGVVLGVSTPTALIQPSPGGSNYTDACGQDKVAIGFIGSVDPPDSGYTYPRSIQLACGTLSIAGGSGASPQVKTAFAFALMSRGDVPGSVVQNRMCPPDQVVVGFDSRAGMYVDQLTFSCAPITVVQGADSYSLVIGGGKSIAPIGGFGGQAYPPINCPAGAIATTSIVRAGLALDAFGLACATPTLTYQ